jgi:hypothetical protein
VIFTLDLDNTGAVRLGSRLDQQASVLDSVGVSYPANHVVSLSAGPPVLTGSQFDSTRPCPADHRSQINAAMSSNDDR